MFRLPVFVLVCSVLPIALIAIAGCGGHDKWKEGRPKTYPTSGTVQLDGQPVEGATLVFQPLDEANGKPGTAVTNSKGHFSAQTFDPGDGLTEGTHRVSISKTQMLDRATKQVVTEVTTDAPLIEDHLLPQRYSDFRTSNLEVEIKPSINKLEPFNLTK
jgi:hypothetical protein